MLRRIKSLTEVPEDDRDAYIEAPNGGFVVHPHVAAVLDEQAAEEIALNERMAHLEKTVRDLTIRRAIRAALIDAGIAPRWFNGVGALLRERFKFKVDEPEEGRFVATVEGDYGQVSIPYAIEGWLHTDEAAPFRPAPPRTEGHFLKLVTDMGRLVP